MTTEVLDDAPADIPISKTKPIHGYYRQPNGWITVSVTSPMEKLGYLEQGWAFLQQYGTFDMTTGYTANNPFELLLIRGGAKELPVDQIVAMGFHYNPPKIPQCGRAINQNHKKHADTCWPSVAVKFPQLAGVDAQEWLCFDGSCRRSIPGKGFPLKIAKENHERVMHKEEKANIRTGQILADSLLKGFGRAPDNGKSVLDILNDVGLTASQKKALVAAGISIGGSDDES